MGEIAVFGGTAHSALSAETCADRPGRRNFLERGHLLIGIIDNAHTVRSTYSSALYAERAQPTA